MLFDFVVAIIDADYSELITVSFISTFSMLIVCVDDNVNIAVDPEVVILAFILIFLNTVFYIEDSINKPVYSLEVIFIFPPVRVTL